VIVLGGAIVPLLLVGLWLSSSGSRAGEALLNNQLGASSKRFADAIDARWEYREADLQLLADNAVAKRVVAERSLSAPDSQYLNSVFGSAEASIENVTYVDSAGVVRWTRNRNQLARSPQPGSVVRSSRLLTVRRPISGDEGRLRGTLVASIRVSGVVPSDSLRPLIPGSLVTLRDLSTGSVLVPLPGFATFPSTGALSVNGARWLAVTQRTTGPPLEVAVLAPAAPYVAPFQRAARRSVASLALVTLLTLLLTVFLATRLTGSLQTLSDAAGSIARGRLDERVETRGPNEVRGLANAFNEMAESLKRTLDELSHQSSLAAVGEFATSLSHDVRNALTSVKVDLQRAVKKPPTDPVHADLVARALHNVARLDSSVSGALRVARSAHRAHAQLDLGDVLIAAAATTSGAFAAVPARLDLPRLDEPATACGDAMALEQLFTNLFFNAAQALRAGGCAQVDVTSDETHITIAVADNGIGMNETQLVSVLEPYYSSKPFGTGIGLAIARQIATSHGGDLEVSSATNVGTTVRVRLSRFDLRTSTVSG
jgi:two-component system sensor histidine kinase AtoS